MSKRHSFLISALLVVALLLVIEFVKVPVVMPVTPLYAQQRASYTDPNVKGESVSMTMTADGRTLFVAVVDPQRGLEIHRIPTDRVP